MAKEFNVTGICLPKLHYMVPLEGRLEQISRLVKKGDYFVINRGRQYGKTTLLRGLKDYLKKEYLVISMDFQAFEEAKFENSVIFSKAFSQYFIQLAGSMRPNPDHRLQRLFLDWKGAMQDEKGSFSLFELFFYLREFCALAPRPVVLMIDEVDSASNNQVFLDFLAQMRRQYLERDETVTFQSVILAGVYDIRNLKQKIRSENHHKTNSPWNIAAPFEVDLNFSAEDISKMLAEYEDDYRTGMDLSDVSREIFDYTSGYPYLVSELCRLIDEKVAGTPEYPDRTAAWTRQGILAALRMLLLEKNMLFDSLAHKLEDYPELQDMVFSLLFTGKTIAYSQMNPAIDLAMMFGFVKRDNARVVIANRIFETVLYNMYLSNEELKGSALYRSSLQDKNQFLVGGHLNMRLVLEKFVEHFTELYSDCEDRFIEDTGRRYFLLYLRPIINGTGNYYIEARTRDLRRTDVIVDYNREQFVVELKIWHGEEYHQRGEAQLLGYLEDYHLKKGYMISFNFNKKKQTGVFERWINGRLLLEAVV